MRIRLTPGLGCSVLTMIFVLAGAVRAEEPKPKLTRVIPDGVYAQKDFIAPLYEITVAGENLPRPPRLKIYLNSREVQPQHAPPPRSAESSSDKAAELYMDDETSDDSQIKLWLNADRYRGLVYLQVGLSPAPVANPSPSPAAQATPSPAPTPTIQKSNEVAVYLAKMDSRMARGLGRFFIIGFAILILSLPILLVKNSGNGYTVPGATRSRLIGVFFLDRETATYSLSKFQFYVWTAAAVIAYIYLNASRCLVQGACEFLDVPTNLPGIVLISASTVALAQVVTLQRGPKGAGEQHPSLADFIASGGIVSAERVQFFLWTIIGALVFLWLVVTQDPVSIRELPKVPDGFVQLMGISSFGYLASKAARRPGPVINSISIEEPVNGNT